jgi:lysozyme
MVFQMGASGVSKFRKMLAALDKKDYDLAATEMLDSRWHEQTPKRAQRLALQMRTGQWID